MASIFWDAKGILLIGEMPHKTTVTRDYYTSVVQKLQEAIKNED